MNRWIVSLVLALAMAPLHAQLHPPARVLRPVADASMVVMDRGSKLEIYPTERATPHLDTTGRVVRHYVVRASAAAPMGPGHLGVVFNHAMQTQGYISGEIAFKVKGGAAFTGSPSVYPGLRQITKSGVYVVNARTPAEFIEVLKRLQARADLEWVEPTVTYGPAASGTNPPAP